MSWLPVKTLLFDLDDTLYRVPQMPELMRENIQGYMRDKLKVEDDVLEARSRGLYLDYGTTLAGLRSSGIDIDYEDWHKDVHGKLPYEKLIHKDEALRKMLLILPFPKYIFTNADIKHAERCLGLLGIRDCFKGIICFESIMRAADARGINTKERPVTCKPSPHAYKLALEQAGAEAETTVFFDDSLRNITGATNYGIRAVLVGSTQSDTLAVAAVETLHELPEVLPELWTHKETMSVDPAFLSLDQQPHPQEIRVTAQ